MRPLSVLLLQSIQGPRDEILVAFFSMDLKSASPEEKDLVAAVAAQDADAVQEALKHVSCATCLGCKGSRLKGPWLLQGLLSHETGRRS